MPFHLNTLLLLFAGSWGQAPQSGAGSWGPSSSQAPPKPVSDAKLTAKRTGQSARCKFKINLLSLSCYLCFRRFSKQATCRRQVVPRRPRVLSGRGPCSTRQGSGVIAGLVWCDGHHHPRAPFPERYCVLSVGLKHSWE